VKASPNLPIDQAALTAPTRHHVAILEGVMLWPDDAEAQNRWIVAAQLELAPDLINDLGPDERREIAKLLLTAPRLVDLRPAGHERAANGALLGRIVLAATALAKHAPELASVMEIRKEIAEVLGNNRPGRGPIMPVSANSMENKAHLTYKLRPVAHLWALYALAVQEDRARAFPCAPEDLPQFISDAEELGRWAVTRKAPKANTPVIRPGELMLVAPTLKRLLPPSRLKDVTPAE
jgi:hypothetical protein